MAGSVPTPVQSVQETEDPGTATRWDPLHSPDWDDQEYRAPILNIIKKDLTVIYNSPPPGICVKPEGDDITKLHILINGPFDTPYEGGFFHFILRFPPDYPYQPPRVRLMTTGGGRVRFNPNLYENGTVCLSILGTWHGPGWTAAQTLLGVVVSIQSLMCEKPYHNEPGYEEERQRGDVRAYNNVIRYATLRTAVCEFLEMSQCPPELFDVARRLFIENYEQYQHRVQEQMELHGEAIYDPLYDSSGRYDYEGIKRRLESLYLSVKRQTSHSEESDASAMVCQATD